MSLTISALAVLILGYFGLGGIVLESEVAEAVDAIAQLVGIVGIWYGRFRQADITWYGAKK